MSDLHCFLVFIFQVTPICENKCITLKHITVYIKIDNFVCSLYSLGAIVIVRTVQVN